MSQLSDQTTTIPPLDDLSPPGSLRVEHPPFALVPEWVIDADVSDAAFRVYSLLLRYGNTSGHACPAGNCWLSGCTVLLTPWTAPSANSPTPAWYASSTAGTDGGT
jgi:hypothetical protein